MSEASNTPAPPEEGPAEAADRRAQSPWIMLTTMLLLVLGFLLTSTLLTVRTLQARSPAGRPIFEPAALLEKGKTFVMRPKTMPAESKPEATDSEAPSKLEDLKKRVMSQNASAKVRWPRLSMTGSGSTADGTEGYAIINGELIHLGEQVGQVTLVEVRGNNVVVEYKGERKILTNELLE